MSCDACGAVGGRRCPPCRVELCSACLGGSDRCPSCQRRFEDTAALRDGVRLDFFEMGERRVRASNRRVVVLAAAVAIALASLYALPWLVG